MVEPSRRILVIVLLLLLGLPIGQTSAIPGQVSMGEEPVAPFTLEGQAEVLHSDHSFADEGALPEAAHQIGPGSFLWIEDDNRKAFCTANFVFKDIRTETLYLGTAGHCLISEGTSTHGADADVDPARIQVSVCVARCDEARLGQLALLNPAMRLLGPVAYARTSLDGVGMGNDFGLIEIPPLVQSFVSPSMPTWGGPQVAEPAEPSLGDSVCHYGHGIVSGEHYATKGRTGVGYIDYPDRWTAWSQVSGGDSGSPAVTCRPGSSGLEGWAPAGIITHALGGMCCYFVATSVARGIEMATEAGLELEVVTD